MFVDDFLLGQFDYYFESERIVCKYGYILQHVCEKDKDVFDCHDYFTVIYKAKAMLGMLHLTILSLI